MKEVELRVSYLLAVLAVIACGSSAPTDFHSPDDGGKNSGGSAGALQGGNGGAATGGSAGASQGGSGGSSASGSGGTATAGAAGSGGSTEGGAAGTLGGTTAAGGGGSSSGGSTGARGGTGGSGTIAYACGTLMCIQGRQLCVHTLPATSGGPHMYQCLEYPDNCSSVDCSCFCKGPQNDPCGPQSACMCSGDVGRSTVECAES